MEKGARGKAREMSGGEQYDGMLKVVESCIARIRWRLRYPSKRRLLTDILVLCSRLRPVVLVDYGGIMPELQNNLSAMLFHAQKELPILKPLKVMVIEEMTYLIHTGELSDFVKSSIRSLDQIIFLNIEKNPFEVIPFSRIEESELASELASIQKLFLTAFPAGHEEPLLPPRLLQNQKEKEIGCVDSNKEHISANFSAVIDLSYLLKDARISPPSLNGWLLGYPMTYLFSKEHVEKAVRNISTCSLWIYKVLIHRKYKNNVSYTEDELMSFSVPCSMKGSEHNDELWIKAFLARLKDKVEKCKNVWESVRLEVSMSKHYSQVL